MNVAVTLMITGLAIIVVSCLMDLFTDRFLLTVTFAVGTVLVIAGVVISPKVSDWFVLLLLAVSAPSVLLDVKKKLNRT